MNVRVEGESLAPGMENGEHAHAGVEPRGTEVEKCLPGTAKQDGVDDLGRVLGQHIDCLYQQYEKRDYTSRLARVRL